MSYFLNINFIVLTNFDSEFIVLIDLYFNQSFFFFFYAFSIGAINKTFSFVQFLILVISHNSRILSTNFSLLLLASRFPSRFLYLYSCSSKAHRKKLWVVSKQL